MTNSMKNTQMRMPLHAIIALELAVGFVLNVFSLIAFIWLTKSVLSSQFQNIDTQIGAYVSSLRTPILTNVMIALSYFGYEMIILFVFCITAFLVLRKKNRQASFIVFVSGMGVLINFILKELIHRPRPSLSPLVELSSYSFPSGHAMNSFIFYSLYIYVFFSLSKNLLARIAIITLCCLLILFIGISRIYLGVHYPTDVIAGYIGGFWVVVTALLINKTLKVF
jgi:undecaprenyl-diphosphatase